jgi:transcriptional regulator with XRE-family HTH domain
METKRSYTLKIEAVIKKLRVYIFTNFKSGSDYAKSKGVSRAYISAVLTGKREPNDEILKDIGVTKQKLTIYK